MRLKEAFRQFLTSVNPARYHHISEKQLADTFKLFFLLFFLVFILTFIFAFPVLGAKADELSNSLRAIPNASIDVSIQTDEPVVILHSPELVINSNASSLGSANLVFGQNNYYYRILGKHNGTYNYSGSVSDIQPKLFRFIFLLFIPGLLVLFGLAMIVFLLLLMLLSALLAYAFVSSRLSYRDVLVIAIHAMLLPMIVFLLVIPFYNLALICFVIFLLLFILGLLQANTKKKGGNYSYETSEQSSRKSRKKSRKKSSKKSHPRQIDIWE